MEENDFRRKQWRHLKTFDDWLLRWNAAESEEEGRGLLHCLFDYERWRDERTLAFLLDAADWRPLAEVHTECRDGAGNVTNRTGGCVDAAHTLQWKASEMILSYLETRGNLLHLDSQPRIFEALLNFVLDCNVLHLGRTKVQLEAEDKPPTRFMRTSGARSATASSKWLNNCVCDIVSEIQAKSGNEEILSLRKDRDLVGLLTDARLELFYKAALSYDSIELCHQTRLHHADDGGYVADKPTIPNFAPELFQRILAALARIAFSPISSGAVPQTWEEAHRWPYGLNAKAALRLLELTAKYDPASLPKLTGKPHVIAS